MRNAALALVVVALLAAAAGTSGAAIPEGKIAIVHMTAIDGLATWKGPVAETRASAFGYDGASYRIDASALASLDNVQTIVLIDRRKDEVRDGVLMKDYTQEVRGLTGDSFEVTDIPGRSLAYQVAMVGGLMRLVGSGDQIVAMKGTNGPYQIWKIDEVNLVKRESVTLD